jgi:hypothetical protein
VEVLLRNRPGPRVEADLAILHVDATVVPEEWADSLRDYPRAWNWRVRDCSKRSFSRQLLRPGDGYAGPVMVKTDANCGGQADLRNLKRRWPLLRLVAPLLSRMPWRLRRGMVGNYPVFDSPAQVPAGVWANPSLVVERLLCERSGGDYGLRTWVFCGDRSIHSLTYAAHPVVKADQVLRRELLGEVPAELRALRRERGYGFGKFDYAVVDGQVALFDINPTPSLGAIPPDQALPRLRQLADGWKADV